MRPEDLIVTASHAIFHTEDKRAAPVAVVGFQFQHSALLTLFKNTTSNVRLHEYAILVQDFFC